MCPMTSFFISDRLTIFGCTGLMQTPPKKLKRSGEPEVSFFSLSDQKFFEEFLMRQTSYKLVNS